MSDFVVISPNTFATKNTEKLPVISAANSKHISLYVLNETERAAIGEQESSLRKSDQGAQESNFEADAWEVYQVIEPRLRNVNRMLADS